MTASPTQRTLEHCRKLGWDAGVVERWNMHARVRHDLFGFVDIVALDPRTGLRMIQATTTDHMQERINKIEGDADLARIARSLGVRCAVEVWGWAKRGAHGKRKLWTLRRALKVGDEWYDYDDGDVRIWPVANKEIAQ